jgi:hypothetical protein
MLVDVRIKTTRPSIAAGQGIIRYEAAWVRLFAIEDAMFLAVFCLCCLISCPLVLASLFR